MCQNQCNQCHQCQESCFCKPKILPCTDDICKGEKVNTDCVIYDRKNNMSNLLCFLGVPNKTSLTNILEKLDMSLCSLFRITPDSCARQLLGLPIQTDINFVTNKILNYLCTLQDQKVKISPTDNSSGFLFDKIQLGECIVKSIIEDSQGNQKVKIELDFNCIKSKLPDCVEVNCLSCNGTCTDTTWTATGQTRCQNNVSQIEEKSNCNTSRWTNGGSACSNFNITTSTSSICGTNTATLTANNCTGLIRWYKGTTYVGSGATWQADAGTYYSTCDNVQSNSITITNTGSCNCTPNGTLTCNIINNDYGLEFKDSCNNVVNTFTWGNMTNVCSNNLVTTTLSIIESNNLSYTGYTFEYALWTIDGVYNYQSSPTFTGLTPSTNYKFKSRITKNGVSCGFQGFVVTPNCVASCSNPVITNLNITQPTCEVKTGSIVINATGTNLEYSINNGTSWQSSNTFSNISVGTYPIKVKSGSCEISSSSNFVLTEATDCACWSDVTPIIIKCGNIINQQLGVTTYDVCKKYKQQSNACGNGSTRWIFSVDDNTCSGCGSSCIAPTGDAVKISQTSTRLTVQVTGNGAGFKYCNDSSFTCDNNCSSFDGFMNGTFETNIGAGTQDTYTIRIYKDSANCNCYNDIIRTFVNNEHTCVTPTGLSLTKVAETSTDFTVNVVATNGLTFKICEDSSFTCNNNCTSINGNVGDDFSYSCNVGDSKTITVRVYNGLTCDCYADVTGTFTNNYVVPPSCYNIAQNICDNIQRGVTITLDNAATSNLTFTGNIEFTDITTGTDITNVPYSVTITTGNTTGYVCLDSPYSDYSALIIEDNTQPLPKC